MFNFINEVISGTVDVSEIDDYIDQWHDSDFNVSLREFLGMTQTEYNLWIQNENFIQPIIQARVRGVNIEQMIESWLAENSEDNSIQLAARGAHPDSHREIFTWLRNKGYV